MIVCCVAVMSAMAQPQTSNGDNAGGVTASDCEGKSYPSVHFGDVFWMSENLSVEECVNDGNVYVNADAENYGRFYNVNAAMHEGLCPNGWSLPTTDQFEYLKANYTADALRASSGWVVNGSNSTGFSWEASGMHNDVDNRFEKLGVEGYLWAVDMTGGAPQPAMYKMTYYCSEIIRVYDFEDISANVRCVKTSGGDEPGGDEPGSEPTVFKCGVSKMIDAEGHEYETVKMGFLSHGEDLGNYRCWTKTNLRTKKIRPIGSDGLVDLSSASDLLAMGDDYPALAGMASYSVIPPITTDDGVYHEFPEETYGYLYSYMAAMYACPNGWHLPNFEEWQDLIAYLESKSEQVCGSDNENIAKAMASTDWWGTSDVECAVGNNPALNNASGFSALPAGASFIYIPDDADATVLFQGGGDAAGFWGMLFDLAGFDGALSQHMPVIASLSSDRTKCELQGDALFSMLVGYSVRCVRDY